MNTSCTCTTKTCDYCEFLKYTEFDGGKPWSDSSSIEVENKRLRKLLDDVVKTLTYIDDWADYTNGNSRMLRQKACECLKRIQRGLK
jgi:hypothetical protein